MASSAFDVVQAPDTFELRPAPTFEPPPSTNYERMVNSVIQNGVAVPSRFGVTREVLGLTYVGRADYFPIRKGMNRSLGYMELAQILAGVFNEEAIMAVSPRATRSLFTKEMAYGPRVGDGQIPVLIEALVKDPLTRQAVLFYAKPEDGPTSSNPCTTTGHFLIRGDQLHYMVNMRSWDLLKGAPYDICCVAGLCQAVAYCLHVRPGFISVHADSAHVYESDLRAGKVPTNREQVFYLDPQGVQEWDDWGDVGHKAVMDALQGEWPGKAPHFVREGEQQEAL